MANPFEDDEIAYIVLVNAERQYSLWPQHLSIPNGWTQTGPTGLRNMCLEWIDQHWQDMRPLSLIQQMEQPSEHNPPL